MTDVQLQDTQEGVDQDSTWSNPAKLSRKVRELAHRSYRALRAGPRAEAAAPAPARPEDIAEDLRDLRDQVARLRRKIHERRLRALIPWVDALSHRVEDRLATRERQEPHEIANC
jgi:hypothetical protein